MPATTLYLVRHAEKAADAAGLSDRGRAQAARLGERLRGIPFAVVHHSALPRAAETADIVGAALPGVPRHACDHLTDRTPMPSPPRRGDYPQRWHAWLDETPADERDVDAVALRAAVAALGAVGDTDRTELLITHNFVVGWFVRHALDAPDWRWLGLNQANAAFSVVTFDAERPPMLTAFNDTGHHG